MRIDCTGEGKAGRRGWGGRLLNFSGRAWEGSSQKVMNSLFASYL